MRKLKNICPARLLHHHHNWVASQPTPSVTSHHLHAAAGDHGKNIWGHRPQAFQWGRGTSRDTKFRTCNSAPRETILVFA